MEEIEIPYAPRELQAEIHASLKRWNVLVCHRRFGKTVLCINEVIKRAMQCTLLRPRYFYLAPFYRQVKQVAWDYLKEFTKPIPGRSVNEAELRVDLVGGRRIQLLGADSPDAIRGIYADGVVLDEFGQMRPGLWGEVIRPALADRKGWAIFIGTPKGRNAFYTRYKKALKDPKWYAALYKASETGILPPEEIADLKDELDEDEYAQEFECSFLAALRGAYYGKQMAEAERDGRIGRVAWEPDLEVLTAWDLGIGDSTAIWFVQLAGKEVRLIDYYETSGVGLEHYVKVLREKPYVYGDHLLPHDAGVQSLSTGRTRVETLASLGLAVQVLGRDRLEDGINAARNLLPRCWFDAKKCDRGLEALRNYRKEWDESLGVFKLRPVHDWASHGADAFRYLAVGLPDPTDYGYGDYDPDFDDQGRSEVTGY